MVGLASKNNSSDHFSMLCPLWCTGMHAGVYTLSSCASLGRTGSMHTMEVKLAVNYIGPEASPQQILTEKKNKTKTRNFNSQWCK